MTTTAALQPGAGPWRGHGVFLKQRATRPLVLEKVPVQHANESLHLSLVGIGHDAPQLLPERGRGNRPTFAQILQRNVQVQQKAAQRSEIGLAASHLSAQAKHIVPVPGISNPPH